MAPKGSAILFEPSGPVPFPRAWGWQQELQQRLLWDPAGPDAVLLLEHEPCYTLGRGASERHLHFDPSAPPLPLFRVDRGGEVTHHLPGQLVLYPVLQLQRHGADLHCFLRALEGVVIRTLGALDLRGERLDGLTGVWLEGAKVAAMGVGAKRWISQHGLALNVCCDLYSYAAIVPCGLVDRSVGRLCHWRPGLTVDDVRPLLLEAFRQEFGLDLRPPHPTEALDGL